VRFEIPDDMPAAVEEHQQGRVAVEWLVVTRPDRADGAGDGEIRHCRHRKVLMEAGTQDPKL
jgi:hypothetical protein